jgi:hypothetical protein
MHFGNGRRPYRYPRREPGQARAFGSGRFALYLRQGRVPSFVRAEDPPALADELAALRRRQAIS